MAISFQNQNLVFNFKNKQAIKSWITDVIRLEKKEPGQINYVFTSDEELLKANIQFLNHHTYTDIITFDSCEEKKINGDIMISIERVSENAEKLGVPFDDELKRVMIHGIFHLCGYKDKTKQDAAEMRRKEDGALARFEGS